MFREWEAVTQVLKSASSLTDIQVIHEVSSGNLRFPIHGFSIGSRDENVPTLGIIGGIHGLERIGTWVALSFLNYLEARAGWDETLSHELKKIRIYFVPLMNPIGMLKRTRSNGAGVDLMRNAPLTSNEASFGVGGHMLSKHLPWYRGNESQTEAGMEPEVIALYAYLKEQMKLSRCNIILDLHSGFGVRDQIWFPFAYTKKEFPEVAKVRSLKKLLDQVLPHHVYKFEPQSLHYRTHGDLWDYAWLKRDELNTSELKTSELKSGSSLPVADTFLPFTLEMGSWNWVKKNPFQLFQFSGAFNPIKPHRQQRTLRRHIPLFDFLIRALISHPTWSDFSAEKKLILEEEAARKWYRLGR